MRLVKLVKLSWNSPQGAQEKYFAKPQDASLYTEHHHLANTHSEECVALQDNNNNYHLINPTKIAIEPAPQPTLFHFWGQPAKRDLTQAGWWPTMAPQQPSAPATDPMDIEKPTPGYDYFGINRA